MFESIRQRVEFVLGALLVRVEHIGSTAVPGLPAKPIIDIDVVIRPNDIDAGIRQLAAIGYVHRGDLGISGRESFAPPPGGPPHHLYLCPADSRALADHLRFRDALRGDQELAKKYAALKRYLAIQYRTDREGYCDAKSLFIINTLRDHPTEAHPRS